VTEIPDDLLDRAAAAISDSEAILVAAGAGMGVDSGLPDFRGDEGFWRAYPPMRKLGVSFVNMANPTWFRRDPELAWGFYGHRMNLYRATKPHLGFQILRRWGGLKPGGAFVFTSNVDGHFQIAGFGEQGVHECHGSIHHLQCSRPCDQRIWDAGTIRIDVDEETFRARPPLPECPACGAVARPNVLMFGDWGWIPHRSQQQDSRFGQWLDSLEDTRLVVIELGAGSAVPTVRLTSERVAAGTGGALVRINLREPGVPTGAVGIPATALTTLEEIDRRLSQ
jgi:NAD-dependent SIR2 family protein deacetylase